MKDRLLIAVLWIAILSGAIFLVAGAFAKSHYSYHVVYDAQYGELAHCRTNVRTGELEMQAHNDNAWKKNDFTYKLDHSTWHIHRDLDARKLRDESEERIRQGVSGKFKDQNQQ